MIPKRTLTDTCSCTFLDSPSDSLCVILPPLLKMAPSIFVDWNRLLLSLIPHSIHLNFPETVVEIRVWKDRRDTPCLSRPKLGAEMQARPNGTFTTSSPLPTVSLSATTSPQPAQFLLTSTSVSLVVIVCFFVSGLIDSVAFNSWNCFVQMQTGEHRPILTTSPCHCQL